MLRESLQKIFLQLNNLASTYQVGEEQVLYPHGALTQGFKLISVSDEGGLELPSSTKEVTIPDAFTEIIPLEEGIKAHISKDMKKAWKCFQAHANLGDPTAIYWKGYYLWKGYGGIEDQEEARKLFKVAADEGITEAQSRYAFTMPSNERNFKNDEFVKYLTMAAENNHPNAQFNLGYAYVSGKCKASIDVDRGIKLLKLAALNNEPKALKFLKEKNIDPYS
jgi:TPR repeat protein